MIIKKEKKGSLMVYTVDKNFDDEKMKTLMNTFVKPSQIDFIIDHDADVYTVEGKLLLKFRKGVLPEKNIDLFYDNIIHHAMRETTNRGSTTGSKNKNVTDNPKTKTNIFGFFDKWSPRQKFLFKRKNFKPAVNVRECRFNQDEPDKFAKTIPLIQDIDHLYAKLTPEQYKLQRAKADKTHFKIKGTAFTTITTNINFQTTIHTDKGDDPDGFGNLVVIQKGHYSGAQTCFPQFGIGVDVRQSDILFMDVHQPHANLPFKSLSYNSIRLSIVSYLRPSIFSLTKHRTKKFFFKHNATLKHLKCS